MKSEWRVSSNWTGDIRLYQVYRLYDVQKVDNSGNRENDVSLYSNRADAEARAKELNARESERFWKR